MASYLLNVHVFCCFVGRFCHRAIWCLNRSGFDNFETYKVFIVSCPLNDHVFCCFVGRFCHHAMTSASILSGGMKTTWMKQHINTICWTYLPFIIEIEIKKNHTNNYIFVYSIFFSLVWVMQWGCWGWLATKLFENKLSSSTRFRFTSLTWFHEQRWFLLYIPKYIYLALSPTCSIQTRKWPDVVGHWRGARI